MNHKNIIYICYSNIHIDARRGFSPEWFFFQFAPKVNNHCEFLTEILITGNITNCNPFATILFIIHIFSKIWCFFFSLQSLYIYNLLQLMQFKNSINQHTFISNATGKKMGRKMWHRCCDWFLMDFKYKYRVIIQIWREIIPSHRNEQNYSKYWIWKLLVFYHR